MLKNIVKIIVVSLLYSTSSLTYAFEYCSGKINRIVTRDTDEGTEVQLALSNGVSGYARIGDENGYSDHEKIQIALLTSAFMTDRTVNLELVVDEDYSFRSCTDFSRGLKIRNVNLWRNQ